MSASDVAKRWMSRAWSLVAATWLVAAVAFGAGQATFAEWVSAQQWLVPAWLTIDAWRSYLARGRDTGKE